MAGRCEAPDVVVRTGGAALETSQVIEAAKLRFPQPLLEVSPQGTWNTSWSGSYRCELLRWSAECCPLASSSA